jgi:hypothetical protein
MKSMNAKAVKLAKSYRLHTEALQLFTQGWAIAGACWGGGAWLIEPDGKVTRTGGLNEAVSRLLRATSLPVATVIMSGGVCGRYETDAAKVAYLSKRADAWHESAFKGWADTPGKERNERLAVEAELRRIAA